MYSLFYCFFI